MNFTGDGNGFDLVTMPQELRDYDTVVFDPPRQGALAQVLDVGLAFAAALSGLVLVVSSPPGYELDDDVVDRARNLGGAIELVADPYEAVAGADAIYTDVWTSMGQEDEAAQRRAAFAGYQVDAALMAVAGPSAVFMHCLPAHRGEEVSPDVIDGKHSVVWQQAENRMHSVRALFALLKEAG